MSVSFLPKDSWRRTDVLELRLRMEPLALRSGQATAAGDACGEDANMAIMLSVSGEIRADEWEFRMWRRLPEEEDPTS